MTADHRRRDTFLSVLSCEMLDGAFHRLSVRHRHWVLAHRERQELGSELVSVMRGAELCCAADLVGELKPLALPVGLVSKILKGFRLRFKGLGRRPLKELGYVEECVTTLLCQVDLLVQGLQRRVGRAGHAKLVAHGLHHTDVAGLHLADDLLECEVVQIAREP